MSRPAMRAPMMGPSPDPTPRTPIRSPRPESPTLKTFDASTASWLTMPAPTANVIFEHNKARMMGSFFATRIASFMSARGRTRREDCCSVRADCIGRRTFAKSAVARRNDTALAMNAALRPKAAAKIPPSAAPTASMTPHVLPNNALALRRSSSLSVRLGTDALVHGPTNEASPAMMHWATKVIQIPATECRSRSSAANAWRTDTETRILRRSKRSANDPAMGDMKRPGMVIETRTSDTRNRELVVSSTRPASATKANQSPI